MSGGSPNPEFSLELIALLPRLRRYARVLSADGFAADDLVQDTLERAWARHGQWQRGTDLRAWLFTIMHNRRVDLARGERFASADSTDESAAFAANSAPGSPDSGFEAIDLQRGFDRLSAEHREVLLLIAVEQLSYQEAGAALDVPVGTVMSRLSRARAQLRAALADGGSSKDDSAGPRLTRIK